MMSTRTLGFILMQIIIDITFSFALENGNISETNLTSFDPNLYPPVEGDLRFGGSSGLFFLHLLKHKLYKLQQLDRIQTTTTGPPGCICVPYYQCDINNNIILTGMLGPLDVRSRQCTGNFEVCCYLRVVPTTPRPTMPPPMTTRPTMPPPMTTRPTMPTPMTTRPTPMTTRPTPMTTRPTMPPPITIRPTIPPITLTMRPTVPPTYFPPNYCLCVYTFQCVNGYIVGNPITNYPGSNPFNPRQNQVCILPNQICCRVFPFPNIPAGTTRSPILTIRLPSIDPRLPALTPTLPTWPQVVPNQVLPQIVQNPLSPLVAQNPFAQNQFSAQVFQSQSSPQLLQSQIAPQVLQSQIAPQIQGYPNFMAGQTCICIPTVQCNVLGYISFSGSGSYNPLVGMGTLLPLGSFCANLQETCCRVIFTQSPPQLLSADTEINNQDVHYSGTQDECKCMKMTICSGDNVVYPEGYEGIDAGFALCKNEGDVCCRVNGFQNIQRTTTVTAVAHSELGSSIFFDNQCGFSSNIFVTEQTASSNPERTYFAEFPWMVAILLRYFGQSDSFLCGGSMVNSKIVLTAGHCMQNRSISNLVARFGEWDTKTIDEPLPFQEVEIETVIIHPHFFNAALYHDVAILILKNPVTYSINVMPICLPFQGQEFPPGTRCYATGWGRSAFGTEGEYQTVLRKIDLPLIDNEECQNRLRETRLGAYFQLHGSFICAGGEDSHDTCRGDGGGPLVCPMSTGQYVQVGIVSWGIGCGTLNPAVYASVAKHKLWIDEQIANYGV